jgi:type IV pilus assembly protein PilV
MNGGWLPMLGGPVRKRERQNACVKKSLTSRSSARPGRYPSAASAAPARAGLARPRAARLGVLRTARPPMSRRAAGFTLIEVMVALIVLVLGVLGAAAMTMSSLKDNKQSGLREQATAYAYELSDIMRANPPQYAPTVPPATPVLQVDTEAVFVAGATTTVPGCYVGGCTRAQMAQNDYSMWINKITGAGGLPSGAARVCRDAANLQLSATGYATCDGLATSPLVVKLSWTEATNNARGASVTTGTSVAAAAITQYLMVVIQPF